MLFFSYFIVATPLGIYAAVSGFDDSQRETFGELLIAIVGYCLSALAVFVRKQFRDTRYRVAEVLVFLFAAARILAYSVGESAVGSGNDSLLSALFCAVFAVDAIVIIALLMEPIIRSLQAANDGTLYVDALATHSELLDVLTLPQP